MTWTVIGVVAFIGVLLGSVMLHEAGHFVTARRFGMKATQFFVGFGPTLWSRRRGETEYGIKAIPAGGFVKIVGMSEFEPVAQADQPRAFYRKPAWQRAVVLAAGSVTHFLIAVVLIFGVLVALGRPETTTTINQVVPCVAAPGGRDAATACKPGDQPSPAAQAGLRTGDRVLSINGVPVGSWLDFTTQVRKSGGTPASIVVQRGSEQVRLTATPAVVDRPVPSQPGKTEKAGYLGVTSATVTKRVNPLTAAGTSVTAIGRLVGGTFAGLGAIPAAVPKLFQQTLGGEERTADGLVGPVGIARISGQTLEGSEPLSGRTGDFLLQMAGINVFIGVFNLLPLLPLDGGHLAVLGFEEARKRVYRMRGRPDPGRIDQTRLLPAAYFFLVAIIGLSVLLLAADIVNPVNLPF